MSRIYRKPEDVPNEVLATRLDEMKEMVIAGDAGRINMRIPAELDFDGDLVMAEAARRLRDPSRGPLAAITTGPDAVDPRDFESFLASRAGMDDDAILQDVIDWTRGTLKAALRAPTDYEALVRDMVNRFLGWNLPETFNPDGGIAFDRVTRPQLTPIGTNLLTANEAEAMIRFLLAGRAPTERGAEGRNIESQAAIDAQGIVCYYADKNLIPLGGNESLDGLLSSDYVAHLLEVEATQPREWDADTIKQAPGYADIDFDRGEIGSTVECYRIRYKGDREYRTFQKTLASVIVEFERGIIDRAFGPIPQPGVKA